MAILIGILLDIKQYCWQYCCSAICLKILLSSYIAGNFAGNSVSSISASAIFLAILSTLLWITLQYCWLYCQQLWSRSFLILTIQERAMYYWVTDEGGDIGLCLVSAQPSNTQCSGAKQLNPNPNHSTQFHSLRNTHKFCFSKWVLFIFHKSPRNYAFFITPNTLLDQSNQNRLGIQKRQNGERTLTPWPNLTMQCMLS